MNTQVTDRELKFILLASTLTVIIVLFIVSKWLKFRLFACCFNRARKRMVLTHISIEEQHNQEPMASFIELDQIDESPTINNGSNLRKPMIGSVSSLGTNDTTYDDTPMPNSNSAYDIVSYANNVKSTLKRTISCDSENESILTSSSEFYSTDEHIGSGKIQVTINYNPLEEYLEIFLIQARDLSISSDSGNDFKLFIIADIDRDHRRNQQTQLIDFRKNQPAIFNSIMKWKVNDDNLPSTGLHISLYAKQQQNNEIEQLVGECLFFIGEVYIYQPLTIWLNLHDHNQTYWYRGEINISLCYHPTADRLTCSLIQARNLHLNNEESNHIDKISTDCYATISLLHRHEVVKKTRTSYHHATDRNPAFNETSIFNVSSNDLLDSFIRIVVYQIISSTTSTNRTVEIGHCLIGNHNQAQHTTHWQQMLRVLRRPVIVWHPLKL